MSKKRLQIVIIGITATSLFIAFPTIAPAFVFLSFVLYIVATSSRAGIYNLILASAIAIAWSYYARNDYGYNHDIATIYGISTYPLFAWASGLLVNHIFYINFENLKIFRIIKNRILTRILFFSVFYITLLLTIETVAYHLFNIHNKTSLEYSGLPICNCLHAPHWMQASYMLLGPFFFVISLLWDNGDPYNMLQNNNLQGSNIKKELSPELVGDNSSV